MPTKGKRVAVLTAVVVLALLAILSWAIKDLVLEQ